VIYFRSVDFSIFGIFDDVTGTIFIFLYILKATATGMEVLGWKWGVILYPHLASIPPYSASIRG